MANYQLSHTGSQIDAAVTKLSGIEAGATKTVVDSELSDTSTNPVQNQAVQAPVARLVNAGAKNLLKNNGYPPAGVYTSNGATWTFNDTATIDAMVEGTVGVAWSDFYFLGTSSLDLSDKDYIVIVQSNSNKLLVYLAGNTITGENIPTDGQYYPGVYRYRGVIPSSARLSARSGSYQDNFIRVMICTAEDYAVSQEFVPYAPTNRELYEMILALQNN